jgi:hypothetical protein
MMHPFCRSCFRWTDPGIFQKSCRLSH